MSREEGLIEISKPSSTDEILAEETEYVLKKLDITSQEWKSILESPNKTVDDYKNSKVIKNTIQRIRRGIFKK